MNAKNFEFKIITPLVMAGADARTPELRTQSIKGVLRWWFRFFKACEVKSTKELFEEESKVFGSTEGASQFYMRLKKFPSNKSDAYLCMNDSRERGQSGATKNYASIKRSSYDSSQSFKLEIAHIQKISPDLETSIKLLNLFGGLGARWRRGFGSVQIDKYTPEGDDLQSLAESIKNIVNISCKGEKINGYMNITNTRIYLIKPKGGFWNSWKYAMKNLRDKFYRKLKDHLKSNRLVFNPGGERAVSPVIIQIKQVKGKYYGIIMVYKEWNKYRDFEKFWDNLRYFDKKEIKLY